MRLSRCSAARALLAPQTNHWYKAGRILRLNTELVKNPKDFSSEFNPG